MIALTYTVSADYVWGEHILVLEVATRKFGSLYGLLLSSVHIFTCVHRDASGQCKAGVIIFGPIQNMTK